MLVRVRTPTRYEQMAFVINIVLLSLYILEIIIKVISTFPRVRHYFLDFGNLFDLGVVLSSVVDLALSSGGGKSGLQVSLPSPFVLPLCPPPNPPAV